MEPWEALDLDDSDLPSPIRPCRRRQSEQPQVSPNSLSNPDFPSQRSSPTLSHPADNRPPPSCCLISGPAGAMQAAMHRIAQKHEDFSRNKEVKICTQDYIRRVEEDEIEEFTSDHWLSALDFLNREGVTRTTCLNDIKKCANAGKIDMVVAMIKSCTPNGLGDIMVVLKDPTGTIHASVHRKVVSEGGCGREIAIGSVVVLQKVSVFSPSDESFYLNISPSNVIKIIPKDSGRKIDSAYTAKDTVPETFASVSGRTRKASADSQLNLNLNGLSSVEKHVGAETTALGSEIAIDKNKNSNRYALVQHRFKRDNARSDLMKEPTEIDLISSTQEAGADKGKWPNLSNSIQPDIDLTDGNAVQNLNDAVHICAANGFQKQAQVNEESCTGVLLDDLDDRDFWQNNDAETQRQSKQNTFGVESSDGHGDEAKGFEKPKHLSQSKASFQQWTDEQLDILDMDDW